MTDREKNQAAIALGRLGAKAGGYARAAKLTPEERKEAGRKAAQARWAAVKQAQEQAPPVPDEPPKMTRAERARAHIQEMGRQREQDAKRGG